MPDTTKAERNLFDELRKPFHQEAVGKIPKGGVLLDYVGHAAVTDRLLTVDPEWYWEPVALTEQGLPAYDGGGGLWIRLTVGGVTRLGYGDGPDPKQRIGDAIRNAAMRFGVALDLWSKDELESNIEHPENKNVKPTQSTPPASSYGNGDTRPYSAADMAQAKAAMAAIGITDKEHAAEFYSAVLGKRSPSTVHDIAKLIAEAAARPAMKDTLDVPFP